MLQNGYNPEKFLVRFCYRPIIKDKILIRNLHIWLRTKTKHRNLALETSKKHLLDLNFSFAFWRNVTNKQKANVHPLASANPCNYYKLNHK
jgi:hypothetical protein